jgi:hypothetical protein
MLRVIKTVDEYKLWHLNTSTQHDFRYSFNTSDLPHGAEIHLRSLFIVSSQHTYALDHKQENELIAILRKIIHEKSDYIFSGQLHKTYLIELVHFITKLYYQAR